MKKVEKKLHCDDTIIDINKLPINTEFYICSGSWKGTIRQDDTGKYINMENCRPIKLNENHPYLLAVSSVYTNNETVATIVY